MVRVSVRGLCVGSRWMGVVTLVIAIVGALTGVA
jgi:hypothetical protein